jgi:hypothetical protein
MPTTFSSAATVALTVSFIIKIANINCLFAIFGSHPSTPREPRQRILARDKIISQFCISAFDIIVNAPEKRFLRRGESAVLGVFQQHHDGRQWQSHLYSRAKSSDDIIVG